MKPLMASVVGAALVLVGVGRLEGAPVQWPVNGHSYEVIAAPGGITWEEADLAATDAGRYLATITSPEENAFVFGLVDLPEFWFKPMVSNRGPWLGGFQSPPTTIPDANWQWVTGESWNYTHWDPNEPNDSGGRIEDKLHFFGSSVTTGGARSPFWNDASNDQPGGNPVAYVTEVPEPAALVLLGACAVGLLAWAWPNCGRR